MEDCIDTEVDQGFGGCLFFVFFTFTLCAGTYRFTMCLQDELQVPYWQRRLWVLETPGICDFLTAATGAPPHGPVVINQTK